MADETILRHRAQGHRESTYAMLLSLTTPDCLCTLEQMVITPHVGCWRDVRGLIRQFEKRYAAENAAALIQGCVRITNAQIRKDQKNAAWSWAAKWVPRETKCRSSPLLQWYYAALAADMFPGAPDANRRYRKLIAGLTPPPTEPRDITQLVKRALRLQADCPDDALNAAFKELQQQARRHIRAQPVPVPVLSLSYSMATNPTHLHTGIGLALLFNAGRVMTFSSHAQWHELNPDDGFASNAKRLFQAVRAPVNGLNANLESVLNLAVEPLLIISDMEHDVPHNPNPNPNPNPNILFWNVSYNGRAANFHGEFKCHKLPTNWK
jgi:hypothetical protein